MLTRGIRAFMARDWQRAREAKDAYWAERVQPLGPLAGRGPRPLVSGFEAIATKHKRV